MIKNYLIAFLLILVLILGTWLYLIYPSGDSDLLSERHRNSLDSAHRASQRQIRLSDSIALAQIDLREKMEVEAAQRNEVFKTKTNGLMSQIARLKQERINSGVTVDTLTTVIEHKSDSVLLAQSKEITALQADLSMITKSFEREVEAIESKFTAVLNENAKHIEVINDLGKDLKREKKRVRVFQGIAIAIGIYAAVKTFD